MILSLIYPDKNGTVLFIQYTIHTCTCEQVDKSVLPY